MTTSTRRCVAALAGYISVPPTPFRGEHNRARAIERELAPLITALFAKSNPVPVKYALSLMGRMAADVRLPLVPAARATRIEVEEALARLGLLRLRGRKERARDALPLPP